MESMDEGKATLRALAILVLSVSLLALVGLADALSVNLSVGHGQIDAGHIEAITANVTGGAPSSYTFSIINLSGSLINSTRINTTNGSATFSWNAIGAGQFYANVSAQSNSVTNQIVSENISFSVEPGLVLGSVLPKSGSVIEGQEQDITANVASGAAPFVYNYAIYNSNGSIVANAIYQSSLTSNTFVFNQSSVFGVGNFVANVIVTDSSGENAGAVINYVVVGLVQNATSTNTTTTSVTNTTEPTTIGHNSSSSALILKNNTFTMNVTLNEVNNNELLHSLFSKFVNNQNLTAHNVLGRATKQSIISEIGVHGSFIPLASLPSAFISRFHGEVYLANVTILYGTFNATVLNLVNTSVISNLSRGVIVSYASFVPKGASAPILISHNAVLSRITVKSNAGIKSVFTNVTFNNTRMQHLSSFNRPYYIAFHVNSSLNDSNVTSAIYNFSVSKEWISNLGISPGQVTLYKYIDSNNTWISLPTYLTESNATSYNFSAVSNSLSTYVVGFSTNGLTSTSSSNSLTLPTGYHSYFYALGISPYIKNSYPSTTTNWVNDSTATYDIRSAPNDYTNLASLGHSTSAAGNYSTTGSVSGAALVGIGANVLWQNSVVFSTNTAASSATSLSLPYTVAKSNSFVIIMFSSAWYNFTAAPTTTSSGCIVQQYKSYSTDVSAAILTCNSVAAGSYTASVSAGGSGAIAAVAYVFPPYTVALDDNPSAATITTNGNTYSNGQTVQVIGTNAITANPPSTGNWVFNSWSLSNSNLTLSSTTANPSTLTVMGNGTITSTWNGISKFVETGLPSTTKWNVTYNGILNSSSTSTISFSTLPGNYLFTVANQVVGSTTYVPSPSTGHLGAGNTTTITFSAVSKTCTISLNPSAINFGTINAGSSIPTTNAITDTNTGNANAYMLVYGGNWIGPRIFGVSNTTWSASSGVPFISANRLSALATNTSILVPESSSNSIYFGLGIPGGAPSGAYSQDITIENSC
jgi:PGF-pre-PGF domain-containing protein